jgi:hypothetical protein
MATKVKLLEDYSTDSPHSLKKGDGPTWPCGTKMTLVVCFVLRLRREREERRERNNERYRKYLSRLAGCAK